MELSRVLLVLSSESRALSLVLVGDPHGRIYQARDRRYTRLDPSRSDRYDELPRSPKNHTIQATFGDHSRRSEDPTRRRDKATYIRPIAKMSQIQTARPDEVIRKGITKREALVILLAIRKKIDIMSATLIESPLDSFEKAEIENTLHSFFYG